MAVGIRIRKLRQEENISQVDLAQKVGISKQTLYKYEKGIITNIPSDKIELIAKELNTMPSYLMGWNNNGNAYGTATHIDSKKTPGKKGVPINVSGRVAAGIPIGTVEEIIDTEEITQEQDRSGKFFGLCIQGDSMEPDIHNGDIVIVRQQEDAENDEIVIALVNGNDGVCKRLKKYKNSIALVSNNPAYPPMYFSQEEIEKMPVKIMGKVVELRRKF